MIKKPSFILAAGAYRQLKRTDSRHGFKTYVASSTDFSPLELDTAGVNGLVLVTRNTFDLARRAVQLVNSFARIRG